MSHLQFPASFKCKVMKQLCIFSIETIRKTNVVILSVSWRTVDFKPVDAEQVCKHRQQNQLFIFYSRVQKYETKLHQTI